MARSSGGVQARAEIPYVYWPHRSSLDVWRQAREASPTTPAVIAAIGDSILSGINATDFVSGGFPGRLKTAIKARGYSWHGDFWPVSFANAVTSPGGYAWVGTAPWSYTLGAGLVYSAGGYHKHLVWVDASAHAAYDLATFTTPYATTKIEVVYHPGGLQSGFGWKVDGGAAINATDAFDGFTKKKDSGALSNATHTVTFGNALAQFRMTLSGANTYEDTTRGIFLARFGGLGAAASDWADTSGQPAELWRQYQGIQSGGPTGFGLPMGASLAIIEVAANDCHLGDTVDAVATSISNLVNAFRRAVDQCAIVLLAPNIPDGLSSDANPTGLANKREWRRYVSMLSDLAASDRMVLCNVHAKWGSRGVAKGYLASNEVHPNDTGHADIVDSLLAPVVLAA